MLLYLSFYRHYGVICFFGLLSSGHGQIVLSSAVTAHSLSRSPCKKPCFEPFGAFYVFPCIKQFGMTSEEFAMELLKEEEVAVVPGTAFGDCGEGFLRISYAYSLDNLKIAMGRIARFIANHKK